MQIAGLAFSLLALLAPGAGQDGARALRPGDPAPGFALRDLDGREHALSALRGRVVVLEWTSHLCPAVAWWTESGVLSDARAALAPARTAWLRIDSSWFGPTQKEDIGLWVERTGTRAVPYLLDADGKVGKAYGAAATPQLFVVDAAGTLVYSGRLDTEGGEDARKDLVLRAVAAALAGERVAEPLSRAEGCTVKYGEPGARPAEDEEVEGRAAWASYARARALAGQGEDAGALDALERAFEQELERPAAVLSDPGFRRLLDDPPSRARVRALLDAHVPHGAVRMTAPDEPGEPLVLAGRVLDERGEPVPDARVSLYHTKADGWYAERTLESGNPRLFAAVLSGRDGRWRVRTIMPAQYAEGGGAAHVHFSVRADGFAPPSGPAATLFFADDPALTAEARAEIASDGGTLASPVRNAEGVKTALHDLRLRRLP
jgi:hypothetical protein